MGHKRKLGADEPQGALPPSKVQVVADENPQTAAERRQQRSERKAKKPAAKQRVPRAHVQEGSHDTLATGDDFVPLVGSTSQEQSSGGRTKKAVDRTHQHPKQTSDQGVKTNGRSPATQQENDDGETGDTGSTGVRFICFVGNLPFSATVEQIRDHFKKLEPNIRLSTDKKTGRGRGFAFLEFDSYDKMKTCLKTYHHSVFNPEREGVAEKDKKGSVDRGRKINVELTAGGGGKSGQRKDKIVAKNKKLEQERERRRIEEVKHQAKQDKAKANATPKDARGDVHPSRLRRVQG